ncbi:zinc finger BED domain-containing protein RICESLEEPER 2-like [Gastrolobium bilobum]|uniref:zinc finger BED domain-containing protein RICESLEEPER 2-like n=1 Tax=Gastrolobium bilobum TaxID=150636 RepID=UPI002AB061BA|nr:zinc finger BED domain-containing protein RICESLEEPER 2-like [Gastrolobium bilobum]
MDSTPSASASGNAIASAPSDPNQLEVRGEHREEVTDSAAAVDSANSVVEKKKKKTSAVWNDFHEVKLPNGQQKAVCNYCKAKFATGGFGASTSHLRRHSESYLRRKIDQSRLKQSTIEFQPISSTLNPFLASGGKYSNMKIREIIATSIMVHEYPFSIVEDTVWMWAFKFANADFEKVSRQTIKNDCMTLYQAEKKCLKAELMNVNRISITTDMWKSNHQVAEYMVITGHFIDSEWELQKRVLNFVKVPPPRRGVDVADAIFKCLQSWGIENKVFFVSVDNAAYNDVCIRNIKSTLSRSSNLVLNGNIFHVRCCAHILNLLVQHGLSHIKGIIENVRESVKYVNQSDSRLKTFCDIVKQMGVKERKLVIDCPTRWNSTFEMLSTALIFKDVFPEYKEREPYYNYLPSAEEWSKVDKVCNL